jgi:neutral ceramidase
MRATSLLALIMAVPALALADELRVGAASVDVTPPVGTPMAGYYAERLSKGVHDPLFVKAIVAPGWRC